MSEYRGSRHSQKIHGLEVSRERLKTCWRPKRFLQGGSRKILHTPDRKRLKAKGLMSTFLVCSLLLLCLADGRQNGSRLFQDIPPELIPTQILPFLNFNSIELGRTCSELYQMVDEHLGYLTASRYRDALNSLNLTINEFLLKFPPFDGSSNQNISRSGNCVISFKLDDLWKNPVEKYLVFSLANGRIFQGQLFWKSQREYFVIPRAVNQSNMIPIFIAAANGHAFCVRDVLIW